MTKKVGRPVKTEPEEKRCTLCEVVKDKKAFKLEPTKANPNARRNQCADCRNKQRSKRNKETGYWKKKYKSMSPEERRLYIKKKSEQNQHRFKTKPKALEAKRAYDKSDKGIYSRYKNDCKRRNRLKRSIKMLLKFEEFSDILNKRCVYCGEEQCKGVDRLDSDESYTVENSVPCCSICNRMKNSLTEKEFLQHIEKIYNKKKT